MASTSQWIWDANYRLYYNPSTRIWAAVNQDGTWKYSNDINSDSTNTAGTSGPTGRQRTSYADIDEGAPSTTATLLPEDQVWPGDDENQQQAELSMPSAPLLRLVVKPGSPVLHGGHIACFDPAEIVTIGRDKKEFERRIRLKELPVSKDHATICWISDAEYWAVIDNGSTHGTFIDTPGSEHKERRLSRPKTASGPAQLSHLDRLSIGNTTFVAHIHASLACSECSLAADSSNVISLTANSNSTQADKAPTFVVKSKEEKEEERRAAMKGLKDQYLKPQTKYNKPEKNAAPRAPGNGRLGDAKQSADLASIDRSASLPDQAPAKATFVDRAAARRKRDVAQGPARHGPPTIMAPPSHVPTRSAVNVVHPAPDPFGSTSKGAMLLSKMGAGPEIGVDNSSATASTRSVGNGLGSLIEPKTLSSGIDARPGLGSRPMVSLMSIDSQANIGGEKRGSTAAASWRDDVREKNRKRFREM